MVMGRNMAVADPRRGRQGARDAPRHLRLAHLRRRRRQGEARPAHRRVGSLHPPDPDRSRRQGRVRGSGRRHLRAGDDRRIDRHHQARGHRLALDAARHRPQAGDRRSSTPRARSASCRTGGDARFLLSVEAILSVEPGAKVTPGDVLARIPMESAKTKDITGGLPRVAELFEARRPKDHAIIAEIDGTIRFGRDYKNKRRIIIEPHDATLEPVEYLIPKGKPFHLQDGDAIEKGDYILDGNPAPHDILAIKGVEALASYLVNEIQEVYRLQGVLINDKHIEVIVRQMLQKVEITDAGRLDLHPGRPGRRDRARRGQRPPGRGRQEAGRRPAGAARHHQGVAADAVLHLGRLLPGDDPRAHRGGGRRQDRHAAGPQGERHRRPADPGRHRRHDEPDPAHRHLARRADPRRAPQGVRRRSRRADADRHGHRRAVSAAAPDLRQQGRRGDPAAFLFLGIVLG